MAGGGGPWCQQLRGFQPTSLPGDGFQVADASGQLAGVEPQAAATVGGLLAGPGMDAVAGVLRREGERWLRCQCPALLGCWPGTPSQSELCHRSVLTLLRAPAPKSLCHTQSRRVTFCTGSGCLRAASHKVRRFPFGVCLPHSQSVSRFGVT